ncbi:hypothetical protein [Microbulbifer rhizosphaerae]|uniref:Uncharacterized protein n=1 Tax=Microbulbifer rhizosphaerae TaxID=1562603 RepID=A0A7W4Z987_9GAMM|nr:hypothetical protein [Microbulbifer rhizosphaerae]MBB3061392.1 hypothetical protein [Microbulbifer rhizosphaerae]
MKAPHIPGTNGLNGLKEIKAAALHCRWSLYPLWITMPVSSRFSGLLKLFGCDNRTQAVLKARQLGLILD